MYTKPKHDLFRYGVRTTLIGYSLAAVVLWPFYIFDQPKMTHAQMVFMASQLIALIIAFVFKEKSNVTEDR